MEKNDLYTPGNMITYRNADGVRFYGEVVRVTQLFDDRPEYVEVRVNDKGIFNLATARMFGVSRRFFKEKEFDIKPSSTITVGELKARLNRLPDDVILTTTMYDYYCDLICIESTDEIVWKP